MHLRTDCKVCLVALLVGDARGHNRFSASSTVGEVT